LLFGFSGIVSGNLPDSTGGFMMADMV